MKKLILLLLVVSSLSFSQTFVPQKGELVWNWVVNCDSVKTTDTLMFGFTAPTNLYLRAFTVTTQSCKTVYATLHCLSPLQYVDSAVTSTSGTFASVTSINGTQNTKLFSGRQYVLYVWKSADVVLKNLTASLWGTR